MEENLEYWENIRDQRQADIEAERLIGDPDPILSEIINNGLQEALDKIIESNG
jgi:hypothetical protein